MMTAGEESGTLDAMLERRAYFYDAQVDIGQKAVVA